MGNLLSGINFSLLVLGLDERQLQAFVIKLFADGIIGTTIFSQDVKLVLDVLHALVVAFTQFNSELLAEHLNL